MKAYERTCTGLFFLFVMTLTLSAHHSWIIPVGSGKSLEIGHGHQFPVSEQAMSPDRIMVTILTMDGKRVSLSPLKETRHLTVPFTGAIKDVSAAYFIEEPVIITRTTKGVRTAPMNTLTGVVDSFRRHRSGVYMARPGLKIPDVGQILLLSCELDQNQVKLVVRMDRAPLGEIEIEVCEPNRKEERKIGKTTGQGELGFKVQTAGLHLFSGHWARQNASVETKRDEYTATLAVLLE